ETGATDRVRVRERRLHAVALGKFVDPLLPAAADDDLLRLAPARAEQPGEKGLSDLPAAENRNAPAVASHALSLGRVPGFDALAPDFRAAELQGDEPAARARNQVDAREPGPLLVAGQDPRRVVGLDPAALDRGADLQETEVADDPAVVPTEALRPDDTHRIRADSPLALQPPCRRVRGKAPEPLGVECPADADERGRLPRRKPKAVE